MTNESSASLWEYGLYGGRWCDQEEKIIFQFWVLLLTLDTSRCLSVPQHGPFFLHVSTRRCLSRSSFWKWWFSGSGRSSSRASVLLNLCLPSHRCAPSWTVHTLPSSRKHWWNDLAGNTWGRIFFYTQVISRLILDHGHTDSYTGPAEGVIPQMWLGTEGRKETGTS